MAVKKELIQFQIENRTLCGYDLPLFQSNVYSINATTKYSWDITAQSLACGQGSIVINGITYAFTYSPNLTGLLASLNALGFGFFCYEIVGGNTIVYTTDDINIYGNLDLCTIATTTTSTTTSTTTVAPTTSTTTTTTTLYPQGIHIQYKASSTSFYTLSYRINGGAWVDSGSGSRPSSGLLYGFYASFASWGANVGDTVDIAILDYSGNVNIQFGSGYTTSAGSGDWISYCGKLIPYSFVVPANLTAFVNINIVAANFVYCTPLTTSTTTTTTTVAPTTSTTTTTTTAPPPTTSTTTTTTTAPPPTTSTTTTTTTAPPPTTSTTTTTTTAAPFIIEIQNSIGTVLNNFTVALNGINVPSLTNISLQTAPNTQGNGISGNPIVGSNTIVITDNASSAVMTVLISDITDRTTGIPLTFTRTGNGTHTININPITFTAGNITNGIKIIVS